jgi:hypothetical protein
LLAGVVPSRTGVVREMGVGLAGLGLKRLLVAVVVSVIAVSAAVVALVDRRNDLCGHIDAAPGVSCPPMTEPATDAAMTSLIAAVVVAAVCTLLARVVRRRWLVAVASEGQPFSLPFSWGLLTVLCWLSLLVGVVLFLVFSAQVVSDGPELPPTTSGAFPLVVTGVLLVSAALTWTGWRARRARATANRRAGFPVFRVSAVSGGGGRGGWGDGGVQGSHGSSGPGSDAERHDGGGSHVDPGWARDESAGYPRDGSLYGDGPQQGTRSFADEQGGFYSDDHRDMRPPAEQPGNIYGSDPFGRDPD